MTLCGSEPEPSSPISHKIELGHQNMFEWNLNRWIFWFVFHLPPFLSGHPRARHEGQGVSRVSHNSLYILRLSLSPPAVRMHLTLNPKIISTLNSGCQFFWLQPTTWKTLYLAPGYSNPNWNESSINWDLKCVIYSEFLIIFYLCWSQSSKRILTPNNGSQPAVWQKTLLWYVTRQGDLKVI